MSALDHTIVRLGGAGLLAAALTIALTACGTSPATSDAAQETTEAAAAEPSGSGGEADAASVTTANVTSGGAIDATDLFTERDLTQVADTTDATHLTLTSGEDVRITEEGVYVIGGDVTDVTVTVNVADTEKVQLVLDGASISNEDAPAICVISADKVFVTTVEGTTNVLEVTGAFVDDGGTGADAAIFSKDDLVLNGQGTLVVTSTDNGVSSHDDLTITGGTYVVSATSDALEAHDSIRIADGSFDITAGKDGLHAENDDDDTLGYVYVCGGTFDIAASDDGIRATTILQIDGGSLSIEAQEALEATYVQVNGGDIDISASDDGINATSKSASMGTPVIEITGGDVTITMATGDTDALDVNGDLIVSGGTIDISAQFAFDFDGSSSFTGGTIRVNGEEVTSIANSMMMGGDRGMGGPMGGGAPEGGPMGAQG